MSLHNQSQDALIERIEHCRVCLCHRSDTISVCRSCLDTNTTAFRELKKTNERLKKLETDALCALGDPDSGDLLLEVKALMAASNKFAHEAQEWYLKAKALEEENERLKRRGGLLRRLFLCTRYREHASRAQAVCNWYHDWMPSWARPYAEKAKKWEKRCRALLLGDADAVEKE